MNFIKKWLNKRIEKKNLNEFSKQIYKDDNSKTVSEETFKESEDITESIESDTQKIKDDSNKKRAKDRDKLRKLQQMKSIRNPFR